MIVGVLAFQGDFAEHMLVLKSLKMDAKEVRTLRDFQCVDALIIPGGESTVISRFLKISGIDRELQKHVKKGFPIFGTCAGSIVLARKITGGKGPEALGLIDIEIDRNAYGRQTESFERSLKVKSLAKPLKVSFIRAPIISRVGKGVEVLAVDQGHPVIVRQGSVLLATCHPEMRGETALHQLFLAG